MTVEEAFEYSDIGVNGDVTAYSLFRTSAQSRAPRRWSLKVSATMQTTANPTGFRKLQPIPVLFLTQNSWQKVFRRI